MNRITVAAVLGLTAAVPAGAAGVYFSTSLNTAPCFAAPTAAYRISDNAADYTVRIDNAAAKPSVRLQVVDDPATADFVLVDDGAAACENTTAVKDVRIDPAAALPDVTVALSRAPGDAKIYVKSARFSEQDAAALFAVIWKTGPRVVAAHSVTR